MPLSKLNLQYLPLFLLPLLKKIRALQATDNKEFLQFMKERGYDKLRDGNWG